MLGQNPQRGTKLQPIQNRFLNHLRMSFSNGFGEPKMNPPWSKQPNWQATDERFPTRTLEVI